MRIVRFALLVALLAAGCRGVPVRTDYDPSAEFAGLQSFGWIDPPLREKPRDENAGDPFVHNTLLDKRVRAAVDAELVERGYRPADEGETPDFWLRYQVVEREVRRDRPVFVGGGIGYGSRPYGAGGTVVVGSDTYQEGTLILDVIDPESESIAWRGWSAARARDGYLDAPRVERHVRAILAEFPPGAPPEADAP